MKFGKSLIIYIGITKKNLTFKDFRYNDHYSSGTNYGLLLYTL